MALGAEEQRGGILRHEGPFLWELEPRGARAESMGPVLEGSRHAWKLRDPPLLLRAPRAPWPCLLWWGWPWPLQSLPATSGGASREPAAGGSKLPLFGCVPSPAGLETGDLPSAGKQVGTRVVGAVL